MAAPALVLSLALFFFPGIHCARELNVGQKIPNPSDTTISAAANDSKQRSANSGGRDTATPITPANPSIPSLPGIPGIPAAGNLSPLGKGPWIPSVPAVPIPYFGSAPGFSAATGGFPRLGKPPGQTGRASGTCTYWESNPESWPKLVSNISTISRVFGRLAAAIFGGGMTLLEALQNDRKDAYGLLLREATASLLNSYADESFPFTAESVKAGFNAALGSAKRAAVQARLFAKANGISYGLIN